MTTDNPDPANDPNPAVRQAYQRGRFDARHQVMVEAESMIDGLKAELKVAKEAESRLVYARAEITESRELLEEMLKLNDKLQECPEDSQECDYCIDKIKNHFDKVRVYLTKHVSSKRPANG